MRLPPLDITAIGLANVCGRSTAEVLAAVRAGRSPLRDRSGVLQELSFPFPTWYGAIPGELPELPATLGRCNSRAARTVALAWPDLSAAAERARERWGAKRIAVVIGTTAGSADVSERAYERLREGEVFAPTVREAIDHNFDALIDIIRHHSGAAGPGLVVSVGCASSGKALGTAQRLIAADVADAAIVAGIEGLCRTALFGFHALGLLAEAPCRPFARGRQGINIGEGCALLLVEREAAGLARLLAVGESNDAWHVSAPHPEGEGAQLAMRRALEAAGVTPDAVDHINAHGTGTLLNDTAESRAICALFGDATPVVSTKGYTGHMLGACGATEAALTVDALSGGYLPRTLGGEDLDPEIQAAVQLRESEGRAGRIAMSNSFGFGGANVSVLLEGRR